MSEEVETRQMRQKLNELQKLKDYRLLRRVPVETRRKAEDEMTRLERALEDQSLEPQGQKITFLDVGAANGLEMSNTDVRIKVERALVSELQNLSTEMDQTSYIAHIWQQDYIRITL